MVQGCLNPIATTHSLTFKSHSSNKSRPNGRLSFLFGGQILHPLALLDGDGTDDGLNDIRSGTQEEQGQDPKACESAQNKGKGYAEHPHIEAVKQEGYHGLTAGAQGKVSGVGVAVKGQEN